jgi:hypothetical protein
LPKDTHWGCPKVGARPVIERPRVAWLPRDR